MAVVQQAKSRRSRAEEKLAKDVRNLTQLLTDPADEPLAPSEQIVRRRLGLVVQTLAAFNEYEDQYILVLQPDEEACAEELAYVDTVLDPAAAAIEAAEIYLEAQDPAIAHAPTVDDVMREREQHRLAARGRVEAGRDRVQTSVLHAITETG